MKQKTYLKGVLVIAVLLFGVMGSLVKADESLGEKITEYLGITEQTILPDSSFYLSKNLSRRWDRMFTFNASDKVMVDLGKLSELTRELADIHLNSASKNLDNKVYELYASWSDYLSTDYSRATISNPSTSGSLEVSLATESLKQLVVINELEKDGLDPVVANLFRKTAIQNWTLSLGKQGNSRWVSTALEAANKLGDTITKKDMLDSLDKVVFVLDRSSLSNLVKGVIISLAGLNA